MSSYTEWEFCSSHETRKVEDVVKNDIVTGKKLDLSLLPLPDIDIRGVLQTTTRTLTVLDMEGCGLTSIPNSIKSLINLERLRVHSNTLSALPPEIAELGKLTLLNAYGNRLTELPSNFRYMRTLQTLRLGGNRFTEPGLAPIAGMSSLKELYVRENPSLRSIPRAVALMQSLQQLGVEDDDKISAPPMHVIGEGMDAVRRFAQTYNW